MPTATARSPGAIGLIDTGGIIEFGILVDANQRGVGLGRQLLTFGIDWSRAVGGHKMTLEVWPHNARAVSLYSRMGFEIEGLLRRQFRRRNGELWDAVVMGLILDDESLGSPHEDAPETSTSRERHGEYDGFAWLVSHASRTANFLR